MMIALRANENEVGIAIGRLIICGPNVIRSGGFAAQADEVGRSLTSRCRTVCRSTAL